MKTMQMSKEFGPLLKFAEASRPETVVLTVNRRPVAALVSLKNVDRESLALSTSLQFCEVIDAARREIRTGRTTTLEDLERRFGVRARAKARRRSRPAAD